LIILHMEVKEKTDSRMVLQRPLFEILRVGIAFMAFAAVLYMFMSPSQRAESGIFSIYVFAIGVLSILVIPFTKIIIDKEKNMILVSKKSIIGFGKAGKTELKNVRQVEYEEKRVGKQVGRSQIRLFISAVIKNRKISLYERKLPERPLISFRSRKPPPERKLAEKIAKFIGVPLMVRSKNEVPEMISS